MMNERAPVFGTRASSRLGNECPASAVIPVEGAGEIPWIGMAPLAVGEAV